MLDDASEARLEAGDREEVFSGGRENLDEPDPEELSASLPREHKGVNLSDALCCKRDVGLHCRLRNQEDRPVVLLGP